MSLIGGRHGRNEKVRRKQNGVFSSARHGPRWFFFTYDMSKPTTYVSHLMTGHLVARVSLLLRSGVAVRLQ
jgi:hypothetical protein